jgi:hypothetical protein
MQYVMRGMAAVALGACMLLAGTAGAQIVPVAPIQQPQPPNVPTPVTPSTPVPVVTDLPMCDELTQVIPSSNVVERVECLSSARTLCFATVSANSASTECTGVFVSTPKLPPPVSVPTPTPLPVPAH